MSEATMSKELAAMVQVEQALGQLTPEECARILTWARSRFGVAIAPAEKATTKGLDGEGGEVDAGETSDTPPEASSLAEFYDRASPKSDGEKALIVGYWFQFKDGATDLDSQKINSALKHLGHGIGNVTRALDWLKAQKPALMMQKRKEGTTKQARKKFAVTSEGKKYVEKMIAH